MRERRIQMGITGPVAWLALGRRSPVAMATIGLPSIREGPCQRTTPWGRRRGPEALQVANMGVLLFGCVRAGTLAGAGPAFGGGGDDLLVAVFPEDAVALALADPRPLLA